MSDISTHLDLLPPPNLAVWSEIKELLQTAVGRINIGVSQAEQAGQTMQHIVSAVERVTQTITDIATSSSEQTHGLTQIQVAVEQLSRLNSDLVERLGDTVTHLHEEALELDNAIGILATWRPKLSANANFTTRR